jgi:hypothetical protein
MAIKRLTLELSAPSLYASLTKVPIAGIKLGIACANLAISFCNPSRVSNWLSMIPTAYLLFIQE